MANNNTLSKLKKDGDKLLFNGDGQFIFYVPEDYFQRKCAIVIGDMVNIIGLLNYTILDKNGKNNGLHLFRFPTVFLCKPSEIEKVKDVKLTKNSDKQDYRLLKFNKGDEIMVSTKVPQLVDNAEQFFQMFLSGKIPNTIPYDILDEYFPENMKLSGGKYGFNRQLFGMIISEMARDPNDITKLFRHTPMKDMTAYKLISIKEVPNQTSPYTAITSENWNESIISAIMNKNATPAPMETLFTD